MSDESAAPRPKDSFRLNARGAVYLGLMTSVALASAFKGNNLLLAVFCVLFGLFVVSAVLTWLTARRLILTRAVPETASLGEVFPVVLRIHNAKKIAPAVCVRFEDRLTYEGRPALLQPTPVWLPLAKAGGRVRGTYYVTAHERGWAKLGPFSVASEFPPGLFSARTSAGGEDRFLVVPKLGSLNRRLVTSLLARADYSPLVSRDASPGDDEFAALREYRDGDPLRRVDWKMSARLPGGRLLVREYEAPRARDAMVFLDTFMPNPNDPRRRARLERAIVFAATLADHLLSEQFVVRFRAFGPDPVAIDLEPRRGSIDELLVALALVKPARSRQLAELLATENPSSDRVYFVLRIGEEPPPEWEAAPRTVSIDPSEMKRLLHEPA
ncbi:MAG TPA: DUF58 domain-containing protein [Planctomycetota bacterium]